MSKIRNGSQAAAGELPALPGIGGVATVAVPVVSPLAESIQEEKQAQETPTLENPIVGEVSLTLPTFNWEAGYARRNVDVRLTEAQAKTLKAITLGLERQEAQLLNGKNVSNPVDAIRWMLENAK